jgi:SAM-dependent methyltransferase
LSLQLPPEPDPDNETLYSDAELYEQILSAIGERDEVACYASLAPHPGARVLELGCGTGRLSQPLADRGFAVTGLDRAAAMLSVARRKARGRAAAPHYVQADLREFDLGPAFELVLLANNTLGHLHGLDELTAMLRCVRSHLSDGGRFVIDIFNPSPGRLALGPDHVFPVLEFNDATGQRVEVSETAHYDLATQVSQLQWQLNFADGRKATLRFQLRVYFPQELDALLALNGFAIEAKYGDHGKSPFGSASPHQLLVCRKLSG